MTLYAIGVADTDSLPWRESFASLLGTLLGTRDFCAILAVDQATGGVGAGAMATVSIVAPRPANVSGRIAWLTNVATFEQYRGRGMAKACCDAVLTWCRNEAQVGVVHLNATEMGRGIYEAAGFVETKYPEMRLPCGLS